MTTAGGATELGLAGARPDPETEKDVHRMPDQVSAEELSDRLLAHPSVARLHGGQYGEIATYLPGRRVTGVRVGERTVEVAVVLRLDRPLPPVLAELRAELADAVGGMPLDITVADVVAPEEGAG